MTKISEKKTEISKKETIEETAEVIKKEKRTQGYLLSKANYVISVVCNGQMLFIQPFGKIKVIKELLNIEKDDAKFLSFAKI